MRRHGTLASKTSRNKFTVQLKEEIANILHEKMHPGEIKIPCSPSQTRLNINLTAEPNLARYELYEALCICKLATTWNRRLSISKIKS